MDFTNLKNFLDRMVQEKRTPGCAIDIWIDGKPVYKYATGVADIKTQVPLTGNEYYNLYSCSKIATITAGAQLLERGAFWLNDPLYEYIPEFRHMTVKREDGEIVEAKNPITVGDLFSMSAGFTYDFNSPAVVEMMKEKGDKFSQVDMMYALAKEPLCFEPGTRYRYSLCHDALSGFITVITGKKFGDYVKENIFDPLGMTQSFYHHTPEIEANMASQYRFMPYGLEEKELDIVDEQFNGVGGTGYFKQFPLAVANNHVPTDEYDSGGSGIISTVSDYVKFISALSCHGLGATGKRILAPHTVELIKTNRMSEIQVKDFVPKHLRGYGYGLGVRTHMNKAVSGSSSNIGEFGWSGAAGSFALIDTDERLGVFFVQHTLNPREDWYIPRLRNVVYSCLG